MKLVYAVRCPYCSVPEASPCRTPSGATTRPHRDRLRSYAGWRQAAIDPLGETAIKLLRIAADAWSSNAVLQAERLLRGVWSMYEDQDFVDEEASADA